MKMRIDQMNKPMSKKNLRRLSTLIAAQTDYNLEWLAAIYGKDKGWVINKLVREKMLSLRCEAEKYQNEHKSGKKRRKSK